MNLDITALARQFYIMDYLLFTTKTSIDSILIHKYLDKKLDVLREVYNEFCDDFSKLLYEYLTSICFGEFRYSYSESSAYPIGYYKTKAAREDIYYEAKDSYNIKTTLPIIEKAFRYFYWKGGIGGKNWANIAKAAMLYETIPNNIFIDHCMDLFHNGNSCFDKPHIFNYCGCYNKFLDVKKREAELLSKPLLNHVESTCMTHRQYVDYVFHALSNLEFTNEYLKNLLRSETFFCSSIHDFHDIVIDQTKKGKGTKTLSFDPNTWETKTPHAKETLRILHSGGIPRPFDFNKEQTIFIATQHDGEKPKQNFNIPKNIFANSFSLSIFTSVGNLKVGDWVKATSKTYNPNTFSGFLEKFPDGVFQIVDVQSAPGNGSLYSAFKKGKWMFTFQDLIKVDSPTQQALEELEEEWEEEIETPKFKIGDHVQAISKSVFEHTWEYFILEYPTQEFIIKAIDQHKTGKTLYADTESKHFLFAAEDLILLKASKDIEEDESDEEEVPILKIKKVPKKKKKTTKKPTKKEGIENYDNIR